MDVQSSSLREVDLQSATSGEDIASVESILDSLCILDGEKLDECLQSVLMEDDYTLELSVW